MITYKIPFFTSFISNDIRHHSWTRYASKIYNVYNGITIPNTKSVFLRPIKQFDKVTYSIHDMVTFAQKYYSKFVIINSDIEIDINDIFWHKILEASDNGIVMGHRYNYTTSYEQSEINANGVDFYILNDKIIIPNDDNFCIGLCGWDWWIPYLAIDQKINISRIECPFLYHKEHPKQWSQESLQYIRNYMEKITGQIHDRNFKNQIISRTMSLC